MTTQAFNKHTLQRFINSEFFKTLRNIPISYHRAVSQINNPHGGDHDVLLIAVFEGNKTIGYIGALPDMVFVNNSTHKVAWVSCYWVDKQYRGKNIAGTLFKELAQAWQNNLILTNFVPRLEQLYQRKKLFHPTSSRIGTRAFLGFNLAAVLPPKHVLFSKIKFVLRAIDTTSNFFIFALNRKKLKLNPTISIQAVRNINNSLESFINKQNVGSPIKRGYLELNWILNYPWLLEQESSKDYDKYYFSSVSKRFKIIPHVMQTVNNEVVGFILLIHRNNHVTVPYFITEEAYHTEFVKFLINYMLEHKAVMVTTFDEKLAKALKAFRNKFVYQKPIERKYIFPLTLPHINATSLQDGDGDCAFY